MKDADPVFVTMVLPWVGLDVSDSCHLGGGNQKNIFFLCGEKNQFH